MSSNDSNMDSSDITNLQENFYKQQAKISALKELVRKSEAAHGKSTSSTQEKVRTIAQRLTHLKTKNRSRQSFDRSFSELNENPIIEETISSDQQNILSASSSDLTVQYPSMKARSETPGSDKIQLLRQQMEQNKLKIAQREHSKRELEEMVTQLKARMDSTQQSLEKSSELGRSMGDLTSLTSTPVKNNHFKSASDLTNTSFNLDKERIKFLDNRVRLLEKQLEKEKNATHKLDNEQLNDEANETIKKLQNKIFDLEENLKEKECIIEARTQAVGLMSENLSAKGRTVIDQLEETRQEMFKMQENFLKIEEDYKKKILDLENDLSEKSLKIANLEEMNNILEKARFELTIQNAELEGKLQDVHDYSAKISELNKLNETLQHRIEDLEKQLQHHELENYDEKNDKSLQKSKNLEDEIKKVGEEYVKKIQELESRIQELQIENDDLKRFAQESQIKETTDIEIDSITLSLQAQVDAQKQEIQNLLEKLHTQEEQLQEKVIEYNVLNANFSVLQEKLRSSTPKPLFSKTTDEEAEQEITKLKSQLDESNKSMIKLKLKTKQLQKEVDSFKKISDVHATVKKLTEENQSLNQKIAELEDQKGKLQLRLTTGEGSSGQFGGESELEKKIQILETTCQNQTSAIQLLEEQKLDMTENLNTTKQELESLKDQINEIDNQETARVVSHMESIQLEEEIKELRDTILNQKIEIDTLLQNNQRLEQEKNVLTKKVDHYIAENIELLDKIEKLSKSSSSAESIEIVERLTQQEKLEIEAFNKRLEAEHSGHGSTARSDTHSEAGSVDTNVSGVGAGESSSSLLNPTIIVDDTDNISSGVMGHELNESLTKLKEESSELMQKIELFTTERREVLEKMEHLTSENQDYISRIKQLLQDKESLERKSDELQNELDSTKVQSERNLQDKKALEKELKELRENKNQILNELNSLRMEKSSVQEISIDKKSVIEECEKCLSRLSTELDSYRKSSDKNSKLSSSKKLAKEAKNVHQQIKDLLKQIKITTTTVSDINITNNEVKTEPTVDINALLIKCQQLEKILDTVQSEFDNLKTKSNEKDEEIEKLRYEIDSLKSLSVSFEKNSQDNNSSYQNQIDNLEKIRKELENKLQTSVKEIDILKQLVAEQKEQLINSLTDNETICNEKLHAIENYEQQIQNLKLEINALQQQKTGALNDYSNKLQQTIEELQTCLKSNEALIAEQTQELANKQETIDTLNKQIIELYKTMEENTNKVIEKDDEIAYLQELLDSNKSEMDKIIKENNENKKVIEKLLIELHSHSENLSQLEQMKSIELKNKHLENRVKELEKIHETEMERNKEQHEKLRKFATNLKKKVAHCAELEEKIKKLTEQQQNIVVPETNAKAEKTISEYEMKIKNLENDLQNSQAECETLKSHLTEQAERYQNEIAILRDEIPAIVAQHSEELQQVRDYYETKLDNFQQEIDLLKKQQMDLNISKRKLHETVEEKQRLIDELNAKCFANENEFQKLTKDLEARNIKIEKCKAVIKEKNKEIQRLQQAVKVESENQIPEYENLKAEYAKLSEKYENEKLTFQETIARLETVHDGIQAKLQEDLGYIESLEIENSKYKEKTLKLEECLAQIEDRRASLERRTKLLDSQLQHKTDEYEKNEDVLVYRLNMLSEHDDLIGRRLIETEEEKEELQEKLEHLRQDHNDLLQKFCNIEREYKHFKTDDYEVVKFENQTLKQEIEKHKNEIAKLQQNFDNQITKKHSEIDELENELSIQLQTINNEKRQLQENLEKAKDEIIDLKDENVRLKENCNALEQHKNDLERENTWIKMQNDNMTQDQLELQDLRMQVVQDKTEIDNLQHQLETLIQNHEIELNALRTQINELDSMRMQVSQNQTDDQVFIETENKKLKEILAEKDEIIENYQRQNLQLQMAAAAAATATTTVTPSTNVSAGAHSDPFYSLFGGGGGGSGINAELVSTSQTDDQFTENIEIAQLREKNQKLERELSQIKATASERETQLTASLNDKLKEIERMKVDLQQQQQQQQQQHHQQQPQDIISFFTTPAVEQPSTSSVFDEIFSTRNVPVVGAGVTTIGAEEAQEQVQDQKKIEDLERNVSDLEKYATDLENKLKHLTTVHEDTLHQLYEKNRQHDELIKKYEEKIQELEQRIVELQIQNETKISSDQTNSTGELIPAIEEPIVPKKAYVCYPQGEPVSVSPLNVEDWGWGSEEAHLEASHYESTLAAASRTAEANQSEIETSLHNKIKEYQERIQELELERNRLEEQKIELQVKSGKMMKKLKEYKSKIDELSSSSNGGNFRKSASVESNDLVDLAIQEELKSQLELSEKKLIEMRKQLEKEIAEKENLAKRVEVLSTGNDRMMEMKEKQDNTIQRYQSEINQLNEQIRKLSDWEKQPEQKSVMECSNCLQNQQISIASDKENIAEVKRELEDLKIDRDELQALLNDEKENVKLSENKIKELQAKIVSMEESLVELKQLRSTEITQHHDMTSEINELRLINKNLQLELNENQNIINQLSVESNSIKSQLEQLNAEHMQKLNENLNLTQELKEWIDKSSKLSKEIESMQKQQENFAQQQCDTQMVEELQFKIQELNATLQYKDDEIFHLKQKIEKIIRDDQTKTLQDEIASNIQEIFELKCSLEKLENEKQIALVKLEEKSKINSTVINESELEMLKNSNEKLESEMKALQIEKEQMEEELRVLNNHVMSNLEIEDKMKQAALELDLKNIEINELKNSLEILKKQQNVQDLEEKLRIELNSQWEIIVEQRCSEIAERWRQHLIEKEGEFKRIEDELRQKLILTGQSSDKSESENACKNLSKQSSFSSDEDSNSAEVIQRMQTALENQELEIVTLKEQLAIRSAEYARLAALHDPYGQTTSSNSIFQQKSSNKSTHTVSNETNEVTVPKSKLDFTLYMLHQRDMRCEELNLELMNLLAERDTLQLKLSKSLRQIEEIKKKTGYNESDSDADLLGTTHTDNPVQSVKTENTSSDDNTMKDNNELNAKISQLHSINHSRDKQSQRHGNERDQTQRQIEHIQEDVARIPPEAVSELVGTDLSNIANSSPSTVLLNWLWGNNSTQ